MFRWGRVLLLTVLAVLAAIVIQIRVVLPLLKQQSSAQLVEVEIPRASPQRAMVKAPLRDSVQLVGADKLHAPRQRTMVKASSEEEVCAAGVLTTPWTKGGAASEYLSANPDRHCRPRISNNLSGKDNGSVLKLTLAVLYFEQPSLLLHMLHVWCSWEETTRRRFRFLVIDDGSRIGLTAEETLGTVSARYGNQLSIDVVRVQETLKWNIGGARNLAMHLAATSWVFLSDVDLLVDGALARKLPELIRAGELYQAETGTLTAYCHFERVRPGGNEKRHPGAMLIQKRAYWRAGGCDEDFVGNYGSTDVHFRWRLNRTRGVRMVKPQPGHMPKLLEIAHNFSCATNGLDVCCAVPDPSQQRLIDKDPQPNIELWFDKLAYETWSNTYLRFSWVASVVLVGMDRKQLTATNRNNQEAVPLSLSRSHRWNAAEIVRYMESHPQRAYFSRIFKEGGFRVGVEVGVADGRFSEHFLVDLKGAAGIRWTMVEPFLNAEFRKRFQLLSQPEKTPSGIDWITRNIGTYAKKTLLVGTSMEEEVRDHFAEESVDFLYLDGAHDYENVADELVRYWPKIAPGGVIAGHDYCNYGERGLTCTGCSSIPRCQEYTEYGIEHGKPRKIAANQWGVVKAVQEWLMKPPNSHLEVHNTIENFTRSSLAADDIDYDLVITNTRNPSWYIIKPMRELDSFPVVQRGSREQRVLAAALPASLLKAEHDQALNTAGLDLPCESGKVILFDISHDVNGERRVNHPLLPPSSFDSVSQATALATSRCEYVVYTVLLQNNVTKMNGHRFGHQHCFVALVAAEAVDRLRSTEEGKQWRLFGVDMSRLPFRSNRMNSRVPKLLPLLFFPEATHTIYIDAKLVLAASPRSLIDMALGLDETQGAMNASFAAFRHPRHLTLKEEAAALMSQIERPKTSLSDCLDVVAAQSQAYFTLDAMSADARNTLDGALLIREKRDTLSLDWFMFFLAGSDRDQISFPWALAQRSRTIETKEWLSIGGNDEWVHLLSFSSEFPFEHWYLCEKRPPIGSSKIMNTGVCATLLRRGGITP